MTPEPRDSRAAAPASPNETERALREKDQQIRLIFTHSPVGMLMADLEARVVRANQAFCTLLGYSEDELKGRSLFDINPPENWPAMRQGIKTLLDGASAVLLEKALVRKDGERVSVEVSFTIVRDLEGRPLSYVSHVRDVTEQRRAEAALREAQERVQLLIDHAPASLAMFDLEMRYLAVSRRWIDDYDLRMPVIGRSHYEIFPEIPERWKAVHRRALAGETVRADEDRFTRDDGSLQWLRWVVLPWHQADGTIGGIVIFSEDITARRRAEDEARAGRAKLGAALESMTDAVLLSDLEGRFLDFNEAFATFHRFPSKAACRRTLSEYPEVFEVSFPDGRLAPLEQWAVPRALRGEVVTNAEYRVRRKDTGESWIGSYSFAPIRNDNGAIIGSVVVGRDITEAKRAEETLRLTSERFRQVSEAAEEWIWEVDADGLYTFASPIIERLLGYTPEELVGRLHYFDLWPEEARAALLPLARAAFGRRDVLRNFPNVCVHKSGRLVQIETTGFPMTGPAGELVGYRGADRDVTEREEARRAIVRLQERFSKAFLNNPSAMAITNVVPGTLLEVNESWSVLTGWSRAEALGKTSFDLGLFRDPGEGRRFRQRAQEQGSIRNEPVAITRRDGVVIELLASMESVDIEGQPCFVFSLRDVTEQRRAERALIESESRFRQFFEHAPVAVWEEDLSAVAGRFEELRAAGVRDLRTYLADRPGEVRDLASRVKVLEVNQAAVKLMGAGSSDALIRELPRYFTDASLPAFSEQLAALFDGGTELETEAPHLDVHGKVLHLQVRLSVLPGHESTLSRVLLSFVDLTERKGAELERRRLERELNHLQRLDSLGRLAGGVSHDMNNVLGVVMAVGSLLKLRAKDDADLLEDAETLLEAAVRGRDLVKGLRDFSRKELDSARPLDLNELVQRESELLGRTTLKRVDFRLDLAEHLPRILGEAGSIQNALMNLCLNSVDAMPGGGVVTMTTRDLGQGLVELTVADNGEGMPPEVLARALEPFFTTKPTGKGTGLGLSQVYGTVRAHGGTLNIRSEPGMGTRITMTFPVAPADASESSPAADGRTGPARALTIFLVDDELQVRRTVASLLGLLGHRVYTANSGLDALRRLEAGMRADLVMLDINMPGIDGVETLSRLRMLRPDLPVLFATGFADERIPSVLRRFPHVRILRKPFGVSDIEQVLAGWL